MRRGTRRRGGEGDAAVPDKARSETARPEIPGRPAHGVAGRRTTLAAIAAEAGVSLPTVSKVLNGRPGVAPGTRLRVPQDLNVVGLDDLPVARWASPPLTTVRQPLADMGRAAAQMLGELIAGLPLRPNRVELSTKLIVRESTAAPGEAVR